LISQFSHFQDEVKTKNQTKMQKILGYLRPGNEEEEGSLDFSVAGLFRCMFCTHKRVDTTDVQLMNIASSLAELNGKMKTLELKLTQDISIMQSDVDEEDVEADEADGLMDVPLSAPDDHNSNLLPDWLYDNELKDGDTETISAAEEQFWVDLIEKYLKPLDMTAKDKANVQDQLKALRDISIFAFTMSNALFVLVVFLLQLQKQYLHVRWPFNPKNKIIFDRNTFEITIQREFLNLEPISLLFVLFFGIVLIIQFIAMLFHRFATISQLLATTSIDWYFGRKVKDTVSASELKENAVDIARYLQRPRPEWEDDDDVSAGAGGKGRRGRRDTIHRLLFQHKRQKDWSNLETNFKRELFKEGDLNLRKLKLSRKTVSILDEMRKSMAEYRRVKKTSTLISPYFTSNDNTYSVAQSIYGENDAFSIYQRSTYKPSSPVQSAIYSAAPLKSALKNSRSKTTLSLDSSIYGRGIDNMSFMNDDTCNNFKEQTDNYDADEIEIFERAKSNDTYI
jgi:chitin synthase